MYINLNFNTYLSQNNIPSPLFVNKNNLRKTTQFLLIKNLNLIKKNCTIKIKTLLFYDIN